jgi:hypothetical protein
MTIFSSGNTKEYLAHVVAVLLLIYENGLNKQCRKLAKTGWDPRELSEVYWA